MTSQIVDDLNLVAAFLAADDFEGLQPAPAAIEKTLGVPKADVLVLLGNSVLHIAECAFAAMRAGAAHHLLICGGRGHSTQLLRENLLADLRYAKIRFADRSEAELLADMAIRFHDIAPEQITVETQSTNCGENARFALRALQETGIPGRRIILVQDATMQLRSAASFRRAWHDEQLPLLIANFPAFVPEVRIENASLVFANPIKGLWPIERFLSLVLGEIPRLCDDANGYGPKGRGFIAHVEIPAEVLAAHVRLAARFPSMIR